MHDLTIYDLAKITKGSLTFSNMPPLGGDCEPIERIVVDSRQVHPGDVFWCLPGTRLHGDMFLEEAFMRGALGVVGANRSVQPWPGTFVIQVADSLGTLCQLARTVRCRFSGSVIAVGESSNSMATVSLIDRVLGSSFTGSLSCNVGARVSDVPMAILNWDRPSRYAVAEVVSVDPKRIFEFSDLCRPQIVAITGTQQTGHGSRNDSGVRTGCPSGLLGNHPSDGIAILDGDASGLREGARCCPAQVIWVGQNKDCDVVGELIRTRDGNRAIDFDGHRFMLPTMWQTDIFPLLAALTIGRLFGVRPRDAITALAEWQTSHANTRSAVA